MPLQAFLAAKRAQASTTPDLGVVRVTATTIGREVVRRLEIPCLKFTMMRSETCARSMAKQIPDEHASWDRQEG